MIRFLKEKLSIDSDILWSTLVQLAGKAGQIFIGLFAVKLLTNALGPENYGVYGKISEFSLFFATAANLGLFGNIVRKIAERPQDGKLFANALFLRVGSALLFFGVGALYALLFIKDPIFLAGTLLFMASLVLDYISSICNGVLQVHYRMGRSTLALLLGRLFNLGAISLLIFLSKENPVVLSLFFMAPLAGALATAISTYYFTSQVIKAEWRLDYPLIKSLLWTSLPFGIINLSNTLYFRFIPSALLVKILSDKIYGLYDLSLSIATMVSLLSTLFMFSILPKLKEHLVKGEHQASWALYKNAHRYLLIGAVGVVSIGTWLAPLSLSLVSSKEFLDPIYWFILPLLLVLAAVSYFYDLAFLTLFTLEKDGKWMREEFFVLLLASLYFAAVFYSGLELPLKTALILTGAILAEGKMAAWGMQQAKQLLNK